MTIGAFRVTYTNFITGFMNAMDLRTSGVVSADSAVSNGK